MTWIYWVCIALLGGLIPALTGYGPDAWQWWALFAPSWVMAMTALRPRIKVHR